MAVNAAPVLVKGTCWWYQTHPAEVGMTRCTYQLGQRHPSRVDAAEGTCQVVRIHPAGVEAAGVLREAGC